MPSYYVLCRNFKKGTVVNWDRAKLSMTNMTEKQVPMQEICEAVRPGDVLVPLEIGFYDLVEICKGFNGETTVVQSQEMQTELTKMFNTSACIDNQFQIGTVEQIGKVLNTKHLFNFFRILEWMVG